MDIHEIYMHRCIELARLGAGYVSPNPMVGCVIVQNGKIIGEGYHQKYGESHAEVKAIHSVKNQELLKESTLYVSLEPCAHFGKTPPCSNLIVSKKIPRVYIGTSDPYAEVAGKGIEMLKKAGIDVRVGMLEPECLELNKRFFTFHRKKRPYIILKWAQTLDAFIDIKREQPAYGKPTWITGDTALRLVHKIRSEEDSILVGTRTVEKDNPSLTVYNWSGRNPLRLVIDQHLVLRREAKLFDNSTATMVFNSQKSEKIKDIQFIKIDFKNKPLDKILRELHSHEIQSLIVEGGRQLLNAFINEGIWDEAHIFTGRKMFNGGVPAPVIKGDLVVSESIDNDIFTVLKNPLN